MEKLAHKAATAAVSSFVVEAAISTQVAAVEV